MAAGNIKVKLNKQEVSYFCPHSGINLFLNKPIADINLSKQSEKGIKSLKRAVATGVLELVEGSFPEEKK